jgi:hypothetical protein
MKHQIFILILTVFFTFSVCLNNAGGQVLIPPTMYDNPVIQLSQFQANMNSIVVQSALNNLMIKQAFGKKGQGSGTVKTDWTGFKSSGALITPKILSAKIKGSQADKAQFEEYLTEGIADYLTSARQDNFSPNDLSFAMAYFIFVNYHIYHNVNDKTIKRYYKDVSVMPNYVNYGQKKALTKQIESFLNSQPEIKKLTDQQKQSFTEMLAIMAYLPKSIETKGLEEDNEDLIEQARQMAKSNLENLLKISIDEIKFSKSGMNL